MSTESFKAIMRREKREKSFWYKLKKRIDEWWRKNIADFDTYDDFDNWGTT